MQLIDLIKVFETLWIPTTDRPDGKGTIMRADETAHRLIGNDGRELVGLNARAVVGQRNGSGRKDFALRLSELVSNTPGQSLVTSQTKL